MVPDQQQPVNIHPEVNDNALIPASSSRHRKLFHTLGVLVFVVGVGIAGVVDWNGHHRTGSHQGTSAADGSWQDGSLSLQDSKKSSHDIELYSGKAGMLAVRLRDWAGQPESLAIIIATISTLTALACFFVADL